MTPSGLEVVVADDALERLAASGPNRALVVMDANTREAAGQRVAAALSAPETLVFEQRRGLPAGPDEVAAVEHRITPATTPVAVGSGVITDIVRAAAHRRGVDFLSVPTAASMDGYASSVAALQMDGVKVTSPARAPAAIFADPRVLAAAPPELTRAGIGDVLAKASALVDWQAAHLLLGEPLDPEVLAEVRALVDRTAAGVDALLAREPKAARGLLLALIDSGLAITRVGSSRPASGCEHHASHFWDLLAARGRRSHHLHGLQVGYATHFAMRLQRFAYGGGLTTPRAPLPPPDPLGDAARSWLGEPTPEILAAVEGKQRAVTPVPAAWPADGAAWQAVCDELAEALSAFDRVAAALWRAGIPGDPGFLEIDAGLLRATFHHATRLRARYTVVDLLESQSRLDEALDGALGDPVAGPR